MSNQFIEQPRYASIAYPRWSRAASSDNRNRFVVHSIVPISSSISTEHDYYYVQRPQSYYSSKAERCVSIADGGSRVQLRLPTAYVPVCK